MKDINLIPKNYLTEKKNKLKKAYLSVLIISLGAVITLTYIMPTIYQFNLKSNKSILEKQVLESNNYMLLENEFNTLKQAIDIREQEGKGMSEKQVNVLAMLKAIELASPDKLFIQKFDSSGESQSDIKVSLKGIAENEETVASFVRNLIDDGYFNDVRVSSIIDTQVNSGYSFDITLTGIRPNDLTVYNGWEDGYSIGYQSDWIISLEESSHVIFSATKSVSSAKPASLEIMAGSFNNTVQDFAKERKSKLEKSLKNFNTVYSINSSLSGTSAVKTLYYGEDAGIRYKYLEICAVKNGKSYIATYKCDPASFENKARTIDRVINSFNIN